jgi:hypothetical protein
VHLEDLDVGGHRIADEHGIGEAPVRLEKHSPGSGQIHRHDGVQQAARQTPLHDELLETGGRSECGINVQRVVVAGDLAVEADVLRRERRRATRLLPHHD